MGFHSFDCGFCWFVDGFDGFVDGFCWFVDGFDGFVDGFCWFVDGFCWFVDGFCWFVDGFCWFVDGFAGFDDGVVDGFDGLVKPKRSGQRKGMEGWVGFEGAMTVVLLGHLGCLFGVSRFVLFYFLVAFYAFSCFLLCLFSLVFAVLRLSWNLISQQALPRSPTPAVCCRRTEPGRLADLWAPSQQQKHI